MIFISGFEKTAFTSPHTDDVKMRATPAKHGGKDGRKSYTMRYHPEEKRWSCSCPDFRYRRMQEGGGNCKHIRGHLEGKKPWELEKKAEDKKKAHIGAGVGAAAGIGSALHSHGRTSHSVLFPKNHPIHKLNDTDFYTTADKANRRFARNSLLRSVAKRGALGALLGYGAGHLLAGKLEKKSEASAPRVSQPLTSSVALQCGEPMIDPVLPKKAVRKVQRLSGMLSNPPKPEQTGKDSGGTYLGSTAGDRLP